MSVEVLSYTASSGNARIQRTSDKAIFNVKISMFDSASQEKITKAAPKATAKLLAKLSAGRRRENLGSSSYMEKQTITAKATVENQSRDIDFVKGKGTILLVARQTKRFSDSDADYGKVLLKESFDISLNPGKVVNFECKPVETTYDSDKDSTNIGGWEYYGWLMVIQEENGDIHSIETSIGNLKKETDQNPQIGKEFLKLNVESVVEKNLATKKGI